MGEHTNLYLFFLTIHHVNGEPKHNGEMNKNRQAHSGSQTTSGGLFYRMGNKIEHVELSEWSINPLHDILEK